MITIHQHIQNAGECAFLLEYTSGRNFNYGYTNSLISNLKKSPKKKGTVEWGYKEKAISTCAELLCGALNHEWLKVGTIVPIPPSRSILDPDYDDRLYRTLQLLRKEVNVDVREIVKQRQSIRSAHENKGNRPSVQELYQNYYVDEHQAVPSPNEILIFDDVLTTGTHYAAIKQCLIERFPGVPIKGLFVARRVFPNPFEEIQ